MTTNVGKVCSVCGALIITVMVNGMPIETCKRDSLSLCPEPRIESKHIETEPPDAALIVREVTELRPVAEQRFDDQWLDEDADEGEEWIYDTMQGPVVRFTPAAHLLGATQAVGTSGSAGTVMLTLT